MARMSPRTPPPRLVSTGVLDGTGPRREQSDLQRRALIQRFTFRAGPKTQERLHRGIVHKTWADAVEAARPESLRNNMCGRA
jgi:hypothetical protein